MINNPSELLPRRNPGLIQRIMGMWARENPTMGPQPEQQDTTQTGTVTQSILSAFDRYFKVESDRLTIYRDVDEMDMSSEEASVVLDTIADNVCSSEDGAQESFTILCDGSANDTIQQMLDDTDLHRRIYALARNTAKYGDSFTEPVVNRDNRIVAIRQLPPHTMIRNEDPHGNLLMGKPVYDADGLCQNKPGECAFEQINVDTGKVIAAFYPWQIVHTRLNHDGFSRYGRSMLRVTRLIWRKMKAEEEALIIGRLTRAYLKLVYHVDATGLSKPQRVALLSEFQTAITQRQALDGRRENPYSVQTDIYLADGYVPTGGGNRQPSRTRVELIDPKNEGLSEIADIEWLHRKKLSTLRVPPAHLGFEKDINAKATLTMQDVQYVRFLRRLQSLLGQSLEQIVDTQLVIAGLDPDEADYKIKWPELSAANEAAASLAEYQRAQADEIYVDLIHAVDTEWVQRHRYNMTDEEIADMQTRVEAEQQEKAAQQTQQADEQHQRQLELASVAKKPTPNGAK